MKQENNVDYILSAIPLNSNVGKTTQLEAQVLESGEVLIFDDMEEVGYFDNLDSARIEYSIF